MTSKQEIIDTIKQGITKVEQTYHGLSEDQLATRVHADQGEGGWTARELLAHLAGRQPSYDMMFRMAAGEAPPGGGEFNVHDWNKRLIDERVGKGKDELLAEFRQVHEQLIQRVSDTPDETLGKTIMGPRGETTFADMLKGSGGMHSMNHAEEVDEAISLTP